MPRAIHTSLAAAALAVLSGCLDRVAAPDQEAEDNRPPRFAEPYAYTDHDLPYSQTVAVWDQDGDRIVVTAVTLPQWLSFEPAKLLLSGVAGEENIGGHMVRLLASDGKSSTALSFVLTVRVGTSSLIFDGSWIRGLGLRLGHDGNPYHSDSFVVYSDFSSRDARRYVAERAEHAYGKLMTDLATGHFEFDWRTAERTIDIFANKLQSAADGLAYDEGFVVRAWDAPGYWWNANAQRYDQLITHELMHVLQGLLIGAEHPLNSPHVWYTEGIAVNREDGPQTGTILTRSQLERWRAEHSHLKGGGNPVSIRVWTDFPPEILALEQTDSYYAYFELAFRYLIDPAGLGRSLTDMKQIYFDIRSGMSFTDSFAQRSGMTVEFYEAEFFTLMSSYLSR